MLLLIMKRLEQVLAVIAGTALLAMMLLTFVDVIGRYGFNNSIFGTSEMIEILMVFTIFAGMAFVTVANEHITVTIFEPWIKRVAPNLQRWAVLAFTSVVYAAIAWEMWKHGLASLADNKRTAVLDLPQWFMPTTAAVLSTLGVALFLMAILRTHGHPETVDVLDHGGEGEGV